MSRELDSRDFTANRVTAARKVELNVLASDVSEALPGSHRIRVAGFDPITGNPSVIRSEAAPSEKGNYMQRAVDHVTRINRAMGLSAIQRAEFEADPHLQETRSLSN